MRLFAHSQNRNQLAYLLQDPTLQTSVYIDEHRCCQPKVWDELSWIPGINFSILFEKNISVNVIIMRVSHQPCPMSVHMVRHVYALGPAQYFDLPDDSQT